MLKAMGISYHMKATRDAKKYAPKAVEFLSRAFETNKDDHVTMCYLGSATTMMAKTTWKGTFKRGSKPRAPIEDYPSEHAPSNFFAKDRQRRAQFTDIPAVDSEDDFGHCAQCGFGQRLSDSVEIALKKAGSIICRSYLAIS